MLLNHIAISIPLQQYLFFQSLHYLFILISYHRYSCYVSPNPIGDFMINISVLSQSPFDSSEDCIGTECTMNASYYTTTVGPLLVIGPYLSIPFRMIWQ